MTATVHCRRCGYPAGEHDPARGACAELTRARGAERRAALSALVTRGIDADLELKERVLARWRAAQLKIDDVAHIVELAAWDIAGQVYAVAGLVEPGLVRVQLLDPVTAEAGAAIMCRIEAAMPMGTQVLLEAHVEPLPPHPLAMQHCPVCGGDEDPCPTCAAWAALTPELAEDFAWVREHGQYHTRPALPIDGDSQIRRIGLIDRWPDGGWRLTPLGLDVAHAMRSR